MAFKFSTTPSRRGTYETELDNNKVGFGFRRIGAIDLTTYHVVFGPLLERKQEATIAYAKYRRKLEAAILKVQREHGETDEEGNLLMTRVDAMHLVDPELYMAPTFSYDPQQVKDAIGWLIDVTVEVDEIETAQGNKLVWSDLEGPMRRELIECMSPGQIIEYGEKVTGASKLKEEIAKKLLDGGNSTHGTDASVDAALESSSLPSTTDDNTSASGEV